MIICMTCRGQKKILSLGNIKKECPNCVGIGHVEERVHDFNKELAEVMDMPKPRKKPGRKPKPETVLHV